MSVLATPGFQLQPSSAQVPTATNYLTNFNFLSQYLPDTYEKEFERYGNRSVASFLRMVGAEMPCASDMIKWAEQGRLHTKYTGVTTAGAGAAATATLTIPAAQITNSPTANPPGSQMPNTMAISGPAFRVGQTIMINDEAAGTGLSNKAVITATPTVNTITVAYYETGGQAAYAVGATLTIWAYGTEFAKASTTAGVDGLEPADLIFSNNPIIIRDTYAVAGSDMAQIGWIEVSTENGEAGYLWYLKAEAETRMRFEDYLETAMIEAVPANIGGAGSGAATANYNGSEGIFYVVNNRGNVWGGGNPVALAGFDSIIQRLDKQGSIEENVLFVNRQFSFDIDDMLAAQNSYGAGGTSYGLFDNDAEMALNLGFTGFRRGYDFYKSDWKYLNDPTMRGGLVNGAVNGLLVPAGSTTVYDQVLGKNAKRPFLHVRYRASETEDRRYKTWITGSAGGVMNNDIDEMRVNFLSERAVCTLGANNFFIFNS
tara:strand:- start:3863 stop:5320 length:1458 start_codon:yes stop_codon:yes gene_type:complete